MASFENGKGPRRNKVDNMPPNACPVSRIAVEGVSEIIRRERMTPRPGKRARQIVYLIMARALSRDELMFLERIPDTNTCHAYPTHLLEMVDRLRLQVGRTQNAKHQASLGQYFTPAPVAHIMASLFAFQAPEISILDAGAGVGSLFAACVEVLCRREHPPKSIAVTAFELDSALIDYLRQTMALCRASCESLGISFTGAVIQGDFLQYVSDNFNGSLFARRELPSFNAAILNPPYKKITLDSSPRRHIRAIGIETSNLYTGFLAAAVKMLMPGGEMVAITPRSFCNGLYFKPFRKFLLSSMSLRDIHLFDSRDRAFKEDNVLQETIIVHSVKEPGSAGDIVITSSTDPEDPHPVTRRVSRPQVILPDDPEMYIRIVPDESARIIVDRMELFQSTLEDFQVSVSTGRVVDFRATEFLRAMPEDGTVPLIYATHFNENAISWPREGSKKPNAIVQSAASDDLLVPNGHYVLVKRFSSKEERRRIVAAVFDGRCFAYDQIGFENHLNYFHGNGHGLPRELVLGLAVYLNSSLVDAFFRFFSGHTQVNATDLRNMRYPTKAQLMELGQALPAQFPAQDELDRLLERKMKEWSETLKH